MKAVKEFNYDNIYKHSRLTAYKEYANLIIRSIFSLLKDLYDAEGTIDKLEKNKDLYPTLISTFTDWLIKYSDIRNNEKVQENYSNRISRLKNKIVYKIENYQDYIRSTIDYISGMTDSFAIKVFNEITSF